MYKFKSEPVVTSCESHDLEYRRTMLDRKFFLWLGMASGCLFSQFIPVINYLVTMATFVFVVLCFYQKWQSGLIPLLALSFLHGDNSVSIYTLKFSGVSVFYILILALFLLKLLFRRTIGKTELIVVTIFLSFFAYSILSSNFDETKYFFNDSLFLLIGVLFSFSIYDFPKIDIDKLLFSLSVGYFFVKIIVFISGVGLQVTEYSSTVDQYSAIFDPIENFLLIFNLQSFLFPKNGEVRLLSLFNLSLFGYSAYLLGYMHGATIVLVLMMIIYSLLRNFRLLVTISLSVVFLFTLVGTLDVYSYLDMEESVFLYKIEKVLGLFDFVLDESTTIYDLPRSTQVRLIETANLFGQNPLTLLLGNGFGGYITETIYTYGSYLNADDYSWDQISSGKFQVLHSYNQIILKHGLLSIVIAMWMFFRFRSCEHRNFRDTALVFIVFSYSFTIKPYLVLALLVFSLKNKGSRVCLKQY